MAYRIVYPAAGLLSPALSPANNSLILGFRWVENRLGLSGGIFKSIEIGPRMGVLQGPQSAQSECFQFEGKPDSGSWICLAAFKHNLGAL